MHVTSLSLALVAALALCGCSKKNESASTPAAPAATVATPTTGTAPAVTTTTTAPVSTAPTPSTATTTAAADLPQECSDYLAKVDACMAKQPGAGAAMRQGMEQTKAAWASMGANKSALASACKQATDAFAQQAAPMKC